MKFRVNRNTFFQQLQTLNHVIASKNTVKILECVLFELEGNTLTLQASDGETTIRTAIEVEGAEGGGKVAFQLKRLIDTMKEFPDQGLSFSIDEQSLGMTIQSSNGVYSFVGENGNGYPQMPVINGESRSFTISAPHLLKAIENTIFCSVEDELRQNLNGVYFDLTEDKISFVATDANRLVCYTNYGVHSDVPTNFILPKKPANLLSNALVKATDDVIVSVSDINIKFEFGRTLIICRQIDKQFPNYRILINRQEEAQRVAICDTADLLNACRRVAVLADNSTDQLKFTFENNNLTIEAQDIEFSTSAEEKISCTYDAAPIRIGFKGKWICGLLSHIDSQEVHFKLSEPGRPGFIVPAEKEEGEDVLMLLSPMLLGD